MGVAATLPATGPGDAARDWAHRLELLVLQPTPFCNLSCDYCYLPDRSNRHRMELTTVEVIARKVFAANLPAPALSVVWHAGEPLTLPPAWYAAAFTRLERHRSPGVRVTHHLQTNGVLLDRRWCDLIRTHGVCVGVSLDGPAWLHDRHRKRRDGRGTHAQVMRGLEHLRTAGIPFHVICVLTREALEHPDAIFDFFAAVGMEHLCFNIEELEGVHRASSLADPEAAGAMRAFLARLIERLREADGPFRVREIHDVVALLRNPAFGSMDGNSQNTPGRMLTVGWDGQFGTFSPELLGHCDPRLGDLALGNILRDDIVPAASHGLFSRISTEIAAGIARCRTECSYFAFCLGGAPANKLAETGRLDSTETMFCRLTQQVVTDVVLEALDRELPP